MVLLAKVGVSETRSVLAGKLLFKRDGTQKTMAGCCLGRLCGVSASGKEAGNPCRKRGKLGTGN